jgi:hypothetical protein
MVSRARDLRVAAAKVGTPTKKPLGLGGASSHSGGGVCTHIPDAPNHLCGRVYQITEVRKLP